MGSALHILAGLAGACIVGATAYSSATAFGDVSSSWISISALAVGLIIGSMAVGRAWGDDRKTLAWLLALALVAGEGYALLLTAERVIAQRERQQAPAVEIAKRLERATQELAAAEAALARLPASSPRLDAAIAAKAAADRAVIEKAAERGCAANCRALLEQQVADAAAEAERARAELTGARSSAEAGVTRARHAVGSMPAVQSASPLADRLGIPGWVLDLLAAALASVSANGLGALLLAFAAHSRRRPEPAERTEAASDQPQVLPVARDPAVEANRFATATLMPSKSGEVRVADLWQSYRAWCQASGIEPLPNREIGGALSALFAKVGLEQRGAGAGASFVGIGWRSPQRVAAD